MAFLRKKSDKVDVLATVPLFEGLSRRELSEIATHVTEIDIPRGEALATEGEVGREAMIVLSGEVTVHRNGRKIATLGPGDVIGEMSLVTHAPRNATVKAAADVVALVMDPREFSTVMDENPKVAVKILRTVAARLAASS